jgi:hypothetical protein
MNQQAGPGVIASTELASFVSLAEANEYARLLNDIESTKPGKDSVWYKVEAVPPSAPFVAIPILTREKKIENLQEEHDRLENKAGIYYRYRNRSIAALGIGITLLYGFILFGSLLLTGYFIIAFSTVIGALVALALAVPLRKRANRYDLLGEEWLFLKGYHVIVDLSDYLKEQDPLPHFKNQAKKELSKLVNVVERDWKVGGSRLATRALAPLSELKKGLREALLPTIAKGEREKIESCLNVMVDFSEFLLKKEPTLQDADALNKVISSLYGETQEKAWYVHLFGAVRFRLRVSALITGAATMASGWVLFVLLTLYGFSKEAALTPSVETSLGLTSIT